jgi:hypothetical protein
MRLEPLASHPLEWSKVAVSEKEPLCTMPNTNSALRIFISAKLRAGKQDVSLFANPVLKMPQMRDSRYRK